MSPLVRFSFLWKLAMSGLRYLKWADGLSALAKLRGMRTPKKKSRCPQPKLRAAQSLFLRTAEAFHKMAACLRQEQAANLYSDKQSAVDASRSARDLLQLISLPLRAAKSVFANLTVSLAGLHGANR
jgi:hypothetical protein